MLDFDSEDIDGMDDDAGDEQEPLPTGYQTSTSSHDIYMVNTPKENDDEEWKDATKGCSLEKQSKRWRKRCSKSRLSRNSGHIDPAIEQGEPVDDKHGIEPSPDHGNTENQTEQPDSVEDNSPDDLTPDKLLEQKNLHKRLVAIAHSLKK